ncbi:MAG: DUF547 domain-containing protein, partial [Anaerolineales bacterium]|nr:DUF547 domain-containing protein [Anaerolineales bacterium]
GKRIQHAARRVQANFVDDTGQRVDYERLRGSEAYQQLRSAAAALRTFSLEALDYRGFRLAFWINTYNALILDAIVSYGIQGRIWPWFFLRAAYNIGGLRFSADAIEHGVLRGNRSHPSYRLRMFPQDDPRRSASLDEVDPRIHMALNCGASSCPPIEVYDPQEVDQQLDLASRGFINGEGVEVDLEHNVLRLSRIFDWYEGDFGGRKGVLQFVARHLQDDVQSQRVRSGDLAVEYMRYDWSLNRLL